MRPEGAREVWLVGGVRWDGSGALSGHGSGGWDNPGHRSPMLPQPWAGFRVPVGDSAARDGRQSAGTMTTDWCGLVHYYRESPWNRVKMRLGASSIAGRLPSDLTSVVGQVVKGPWVGK